MRPKFSLANVLTMLGVLVSAGSTWAQDTTPPEIGITLPAEASRVVRCSTLPISFTVTDGDSGVDLSSIALTVGGVAVAATPGSDGTFSAAFDLQFVPLGSLTVSVTARDLAGNEATAIRTLTVDCTFACARTLIVRASASNAFRCAGVDEMLFQLLQRAEQVFNASPRNEALYRNLLELALDCVQRPSRELRQNAAGLRTPIGGRASFNRDAQSEAFARVIEEEILCLLMLV